MANTSGVAVDVAYERDHAVLRLDGRLSPATATEIRAALGTFLADPGCVLIDLSRLRLDWQPAVEVFPAALTAAGGWPLGRILLFGADPGMTAGLHAARVPRTVPLVDNLSAALVEKSVLPQRVHRHRDLPMDLYSPASARYFLREVCDDWEVDDVYHAAVLVATELVTNAVEHAQSASRLSVSLDDAGFRISVRDYLRCEAPRPRPIDIRSKRGRGLLMMAALAANWGVTEHPDGKSVWATLSPH